MFPQPTGVFLLPRELPFPTLALCSKTFASMTSGSLFVHSSGGAMAEGTLGSPAGDCRKGNRRGTEAWSVWWRRAVGTLVDGCGGQCKVARSRASFWMKVKGEWLKRTLRYENDVGHWVRRGPRGPCFLTDAIKQAQRPEEAVSGLLSPRYLLGALLGSKGSL